jgi:uncharacterized membrane protein
MGQVVMVTVGQPSVRLLGFVTREDFSDCPEGMGGEDKVAVYLPMSYQIGGYTVNVPRSCVEPIDMSFQDAMRYALTAGMAAAEKTGPTVAHAVEEKLRESAAEENGGRSASEAAETAPPSDVRSGEREEEKRTEP